MIKYPENITGFKIAIFSLNGDENINGINPKLMKDIITHRHLLHEENGLEEFYEKIGGRRWEYLLKSDLTKDTPNCRYKVKEIKLIFEREIAEAKLEAYQNPFSGADKKVKILQELSHEIGWNL